MYCSNCATPLAPGLSYCNRCGASLKEHNDSKTGAISAYLTAITLIGIAGLGLMLGGAIALRNGAQFGEELISVFMLMVFLIIGIVEILLCKQLSRLNSTSEKSKSLAQPLQATMSTEFRDPHARALPEPIPSVTENTTRTLEYSGKEPSR